MKYLITIILLLFCFLLTGQTGDCGYHSFKIQNPDGYNYDTMYVERVNDCPLPVEFSSDNFFWEVPDRLDYYEWNEVTQSWDFRITTGWIGHPLYGQCTPLMNYGFLYFINDTIIYDWYLPRDWSVHPEGKTVQPHGASRVIFDTTASKIMVVWTSNPCYGTYTDILIRCTNFRNVTWHDGTEISYTCYEDEVSIDTVHTGCGYVVYETIHIPPDPQRDTICGFEGDVKQYKDLDIKITQSEERHFERWTLGGCYTTDTLVIEMIKIFMPNIISFSDYGVNGKYKPFFSVDGIDYNMSIYDRWGNLVYEGREWKPEQNHQDGVYVALIKVKERLFSTDFTVVK